MALFAIGDLHLSLSTEKPMDVFGGEWIDYVDKIKAGFQRMESDDVCVLCGDISWGMSLEDSLADFQFIDNLPGKKIILKGNHDYWWNTATKIKNFFDANNITSIDILHNNCFFYNDTAICGTRGWMSDDECSLEQNKKISDREAIRLQASLQTAKDAGETICFFHYPPRFRNTICYDIISLMNEYNVKKCYYGHLHGDGHRFATQGLVDGIEYGMVSADFLNFVPYRIME
ncbi:MAG: metallophosphoesterase [Oscillospiraceae bacterium]|nr:metallophosphoesterase [Oscillospiraceae bacterium]